MTTTSNPPPQAGDHAPNGTLPDGTQLSELRGQPVILAFAPDEWNPAHAYQSQVFARLTREFAGGTDSVDPAPESWHSLDCHGELAAQFGVTGQRALFLLDEAGIVRWKIAVDPTQSIRPGQVLAALQDFRAPAAPPTIGGMSRRTFVTATLAAAALLVLLPGASAATDSAPKALNPMLPPDPTDLLPVTLKVNGKTYPLQLEPRVALLDALRENLHLTGTKKGCDHGQCGACTVHLDGQSALSCLTLAVMSEGKEITTIEGLAKGETLHPLQAAFLKHDAFQCGYCTPGQLMAASALLQDKQPRAAVEIQEAMSGNLCRCAAYPNIIAAIQEAQGA